MHLVARKIQQEKILATHKLQQVMCHVPKITAGFSLQRIGSIQGIFVVSKVTLQLGFLKTIAFSFINNPKKLHDPTHLSVVYDS